MLFFPSLSDLLYLEITHPLPSKSQANLLSQVEPAEKLL